MGCLQCKIGSVSDMRRKPLISTQKSDSIGICPTDRTISILRTFLRHGFPNWLTCHVISSSLLMRIEQMTQTGRTPSYSQEFRERLLRQQMQSQVSWILRDTMRLGGYGFEIPKRRAWLDGSTLRLPSDGPKRRRTLDIFAEISSIA